MSLLSEVDGCCCGERHQVSTAVLARFDQATAGLGPEVIVDVPGGRWRVPRLFIACHGLKAADLPRLAGVYGWERAGGDPGE